MRNARKDKGADASGSYRNREDPNLVGVESTGTPTSVRFVRLEDCNVNLKPQRRGKVKGGLKKRSSRWFGFPDSQVVQKRARVVWQITLMSEKTWSKVA